jgi:pyruvate-formate lyase
LLGIAAAFSLREASNESEAMGMVRVKLSQKVFTEEEVTSLTGICREHLRDLARNRHLGTLAGMAEAAAGAQEWLFSNSDLMIMTALHPRCQH